MLTELLLASAIVSTYDGSVRDSQIVRLPERLQPAATSPQAPPPFSQPLTVAPSATVLATPVHGQGYYSGPVAIDTARMPDGTYALFDPTRGSKPNPVLQYYQPDGNGWSST